jgi:pimeloyl-ACP methyl ester carboxylesterase
VNTVLLSHNKVRLALRELRGGTGRPLLLLHGLGEPPTTRVPAWADPWAGPVHALDFTGHGDSTVPAGGGYSAEILLADADIALTALGQATVVGRGLGAYIALMLAGARPQLVRGAVLCDGPGLAGGAVGPTSQSFLNLPRCTTTPDHYALIEMSHDLRPPDYATQFVRLAVQDSGLDEPIAVTGIVRPPWLAAVVDEVGVTTCTVAEALATFAAV